MPNTLVQVEGELLETKRVYFTGTDTIRGGYHFCFDADRGTAASKDGTRAMYVEKPSTTNREHYTGVATENMDGKTGPCYIDIYLPSRSGRKVNVWTEESCTIDSTVLTLKAGSFAAGGVGEGPIIGKAVQTIDRSTTNGVVQALLVGVDPAELTKTGAAGGTGPSPLIWDDCPWDEIGRDPSIGFRYFNDYLGTIDVTTADGYVITAVTSGNIEAVVDEQGGVLQCSSGGNATADDGVNVQLQNCMVKPAAGVKVFYEARCKMTDTGDDQYFIGLAGVDTTLIAAGIMDDVVSKCGFFRIAASTADKISSITARTSEDDATANVGDLTDATYVNLGFVIDGLTSVKFYVDGVLVETGATAAAIANDVMCLSYVAQVEQTSADADLEVDWVKIAQVGGRA